MDPYFYTGDVSYNSYRITLNLCRLHAARIWRKHLVGISEIFATSATSAPILIKLHAVSDGKIKALDVLDSSKNCVEIKSDILIYKDS